MSAEQHADHEERQQVGGGEVCGMSNNVKLKVEIGYFTLLTDLEAS